MSAILFEKRGHQAWITLNRPDQKNLMNGEMFVQWPWSPVPATRIFVAAETWAG
jgi:enoyl-CoA hydratase